MLIQALRHYPEAVGLPLLLLLAAVFFGLTNPRSVPSVLLIGGFILIFAIVLLSLRLGLRAGGLGKKLPAAWRGIITWGGAGLAVIFIALQSIGQLTVRDVVTIAALFATGCFYVLRGRKR